MPEEVPPIEPEIIAGANKSSVETETNIDSRAGIDSDDIAALEAALSKGDSTGLSSTAKTQYDNEMATRKQQNDVLGKYYGLDGTKLDPTKTFEDNIKSDSTLSDKVQKKFSDQFGTMDVKDLTNLGDKLATKVKNDPTDKSSKVSWETVKSLLKYLGGIGASIGTAIATYFKAIAGITALLALLQAIADGMSGCYQSNATTGTRVKLDCDTSDAVKAACNCTSYDLLVPLCPDANGKTCPTYLYVYRKYSIGDILAGIITAVGNIPSDIVGIFGWIKNNWMLCLGVFIGLIVLLFMIPFLLKKAVSPPIE